ncbi:MAG: GDP-L-fucose synthase [Pseudomonadota bacterium]
MERDTPASIADPGAKIYVAGHRGMVGSAICRALEARGHTSVIRRTSGELDLTDQDATDAFFSAERPDYVFLAAAKVGGILANDTQGADFIRQNLRIQTNVIDAAYRNGARKLLFLGSSCIYPKHAEQPISEEALLTGALEPTNLPYAIAKIAGKTMCDAYRRQYGFDAFTVMPSNVYGVGDNFDPESSHVVAGLMRRFHEAARSGAAEVIAWGDGSPMRELVDADDLGDACVFLMETYQQGGMINAGSSQEISIRALTELMAEITGFAGRITWDTTKPNGTPRKIMDNARLHALGWQPRTSIEAGLRKMYDWYRQSLLELSVQSADRDASASASPAQP